MVEPPYVLLVGRFPNCPVLARISEYWRESDFADAIRAELLGFRRVRRKADRREGRREREYGHLGVLFGALP